MIGNHMVLSWSADHDSFAMNVRDRERERSTTLLDMQGKWAVYTHLMDHPRFTNLTHTRTKKKKKKLIQYIYTYIYQSHTKNYKLLFNFKKYKYNIHPDK